MTANRVRGQNRRGPNEASETRTGQSRQAPQEPLQLSCRTRWDGAALRGRGGEEGRGQDDERQGDGGEDAVCLLLSRSIWRGEVSVRQAVSAKVRHHPGSRLSHQDLHRSRLGGGKIQM